MSQFHLLSITYSSARHLIDAAHAVLLALVIDTDEGWEKFRKRSLQMQDAGSDRDSSSGFVLLRKKNFRRVFRLGLR
jgi:hypothetical protein